LILFERDRQIERDRETERWRGKGGGGWRKRPVEGGLNFKDFDKGNIVNDVIYC